MALTDTSTSTARTLRPMVGTLSNRYGVVAACVILPPIISLYCLTAASGTWGYIALLHVLLSVMVLALSRALHRARIVIEPSGLTETDLFTRPVHTPRSEMREIRIIPISDGNSSTAYDQLFVLDQHGAARLRIRGQFWGRETVDAVAAAFDLPVTRIDAPRVMRDVRKEGLVPLYWHERHPYLYAILFGVGALAIVGPMLWFVQQII